MSENIVSVLAIVLHICTHGACQDKIVLTGYRNETDCIAALDKAWDHQFDLYATTAQCVSLAVPE